MAKTRTVDSKEALGRQRAELGRGSRHPRWVGQDRGAALARQEELAKVRRMREAQRARKERERPVAALLAQLAGDAFRLAGTLVAFPFRLAAALRGRRAGEA